MLVVVPLPDFPSNNAQFPANPQPFIRNNRFISTHKSTKRNPFFICFIKQNNQMYMIRHNNITIQCDTILLYNLVQFLICNHAQLGIFYRCRLALTFIHYSRQCAFSILCANCDKIPALATIIIISQASIFSVMVYHTLPFPFRATARVAPTRSASNLVQESL